MAPPQKTHRLTKASEAGDEDDQENTKSPTKTKMSADMDRLFNELEKLEDPTENVRIIRDRVRKFRDYIVSPENKERRLSSVGVQNYIATHLLDYVVKMVKQMDEENTLLREKFIDIQEDIEKLDMVKRRNVELMEGLREKEVQLEESRLNVGKLIEELKSFGEKIMGEEGTLLREMDKKLEENTGIKEIRKITLELQEERRERNEMGKLIEELRKEVKNRDSQTQRELRREMEELERKGRERQTVDIKKLIEKEKEDIIRNTVEQVRKVLNEMQEEEEGETDKNINELKETVKEIGEELRKSRIDVSDRSIETLREAMENMRSGKEEMAKTMASEIKNILKENDKQEEGNLRVPTYAEMTYRNRSRDRSGSRTRVPPQAPSLVIKSKEGTNYEEMIKNIRKTVSIDTENIRINKLRKIKDGVVADLASNEDLENLRTMLENGEETKHYEIHKTKKREPQIIIRNVDKEITEEELLKGLKSKNEALKNTNLKIDLKLPSRGKVHYVISLSPHTFREIIKQKYVYSTWERYYINEFVSVKQCSACGTMGHTRGKCPYPLTICLNCGDDGEHNRKNCKIRCINCEDNNKKFKLSNKIDHSCKSPQCPIFLRARAQSQKFIDYGE